MLALPEITTCGPPLTNVIHNCDALTLAKALPDNTVNCVVTSPPYYGLRSYLNNDDMNKPKEIGQEETPAAYIDRLVVLFREIRRVLRDDGTLWLNAGDGYASGEVGRHDSVQGRTIDGRRVTSKAKVRQYGQFDTGLPSKNLLMIPARLAIALQADGWVLRADLIWYKPNPMPESVTDRPTKSHEYIFLLSKSSNYYYDTEAIRETAKTIYGNRNAFRGGGAYTDHNSFNNSAKKQNAVLGHSKEPVIDRNKHSVWIVPTYPYAGAHFATFPPKLIEPMILAGCPVGGLVYDPFGGSGTTALVARNLGRNYILSELNHEYAELARSRLAEPYTPMLFDVHASYDTTGTVPQGSQVDLHLPGFDIPETA